MGQDKFANLLGLVREGRYWGDCREETLVGDKVFILATPDRLTDSELLGYVSLLEAVPDWQGDWYGENFVSTINKSTGYRVTLLGLLVKEQEVIATGMWALCPFFVWPPTPQQKLAVSIFANLAVKEAWKGQGFGKSLTKLMFEQGPKATLKVVGQLELGKLLLKDGEVIPGTDFTVTREAVLAGLQEKPLVFTDTETAAGAAICAYAAGAASFVRGTSSDALVNTPAITGVNEGEIVIVACDSIADGVKTRRVYLVRENIEEVWQTFLRDFSPEVDDGYAKFPLGSELPALLAEGQWGAKAEPPQMRYAWEIPVK